MRFFLGYKNLFLTFSEVNGVSSIVELFLTFWKVKSGQWGSIVGEPKKAAGKEAESRKAHMRGKQHKQQRAPTAGTQEKTSKGSAKAAKSSKQQEQHKHEKQQQSSTNNNSESCTKQFKQQSKQRHEGPEGGAPKVSLCSHWRLLVEFRWCLSFFFFEIPVNFILIGYAMGS